MDGKSKLYPRHLLCTNIKYLPTSFNLHKFSQKPIAHTRIRQLSSNPKKKHLKEKKRKKRLPPKLTVNFLFDTAEKWDVHLLRPQGGSRLPPVASLASLPPATWRRMISKIYICIYKYTCLLYIHVDII